MHPVICKIGPVTIYSYGLMLAIAFLTSTWLVTQEARRKKFNPAIIFNLSFLVLAWGIIGARAFYIIENFGLYLKSPVEIFMLQHGGLSWFGGMLLGLSAASIYLKRSKSPIYTTFDLVAPFAALAQALGRVGCLLNGCCFGSTFIPIQIYSALSLLAIFILLRLLQERPHKAGSIFYAYLLLYSAKRFFIEFWRLDNPPIFFGLTLFQIISLILFVISLAWFFIFRIIKNAKLLP